MKKIIFVMLFFIASGQVFSQEQEKDSIETILPTIDFSIQKKYLIKEIKVTGIKYIAPQLAADASGLAVGDSILIPGDRISNAINTLWEYKTYSDIKINTRFDGDDVYIELVLKERPRVSEWIIKGVKTGEEDEIRSRLKIDKKETKNKRIEFSEYQINNSINIIKRYLQEKGYNFADVAVSNIQDPKYSNFVIVTFDIDKKNKVKIGEIVIDGNENLNENKLKASMKETREKRLKNMLKGSKFNQTNYDADKDLLISYMQSKGYRDAAILSDSIYKISDKRMGIKLTVDEGKKYYYRNISWIGNTKYDTDYLSLILGVSKGDIYDKKNMNSRLGIGVEGMESTQKGDMTVSSIYKNDGYLAFNIEPVETVIEGDSIDIELRMVEGNPYKINNVYIAGNQRTHDRSIRRELYLMPGELYDQSMLIATMTNLGAMQHFEMNSLQPDIEPVSNDLVDIKYNLIEQSSDQFELSGGWGAGMFVATVGVSFNNLSLRKVFDKNAWRPYPAGDNQKFKINVQTNGTYYKAISMSFLEPWLGGKKPTNFSISLYYSAETNAYYAWQRANKRFRTLGISVGIGKRLKWPDPNFNLTGEFGFQSYNLKDWDYFLIKNGVSNIVTASATLSRNSTDNVMYPSRGSNFSFKVTATPPYSLFNKKDYTDPKMDNAEKYKWVEFYKINSSFRWFLPLVKNKLVLMTKAEFGYLGHYNPKLISPFEGFTMGGDGVSGYNLYGIQDIGLRGYDEGVLTPYAQRTSEQAKAYTKYTAELRYPLVMEGQTNVYALIFAEAGNAYKSWGQFNPFNLKRSLGVGLRIYLPIVGMFGVDWGYGFDKIPELNVKGGSQLHFSIGGEF